VNEAPLGKAGRDVDEITIRLADAQASREEAVASHDGSICPASGTLIHPNTRRGVYRSVAGINVPSLADNLWGFLNLDRARVARQVDGQYKGARLPLTRDDLVRHLAGEITLAISVLRDGVALFAGIDIDARFEELLPIVRAAAEGVGGSELVDAMFGTSGSYDGRGKVILTLEKPASDGDARALAQHVARLIRASAVAEGIPGNEISAYPQSGQGGLLRVLGRNAKRDGPLELPFSLNGEPGLSYLRPLKPTTVARIVASLRSGVSPWARRLLNDPWRRTEGTHRHYGHMVALAREALRIHGPISGCSAYGSWIDQVKSNSPELLLLSLKTKDRRNVLDHGRERAWEWARQHPTSWEPLDLQSRKDVSAGVARQYTALVSFVRDNGLRPECFGIDYERAALAALDGSSKSTAYRRVLHADKIGVIVILDPGLPREQGLSGECALLGLVCRGQMPEQVRAAAAASDLVRKRMECRAQRAARDVSRHHKTAQSGEITGTQKSAAKAFGNEERERRGKVIPFPQPCIRLRPSARALRDEMLRGPVGQYILGITENRATG
jgi:hypothetical protein